MVQDPGGRPRGEGQRAGRGTEVAGTVCMMSGIYLGKNVY